MSASHRTIEAEELLRKLDAGEPFVLVDALSPMSYAHSHLPGAINLPPERVDGRIRRRIDPASEIVVYCANAECDESTQTAERLLALGYDNVLEYAGGKDEWRSLGYPLERAGRPYVEG